MTLTARDALTDRLVRVNDEERPDRVADPHVVVYAVFGGQDGKFFGVVTSREVVQHPHRIFADLVDRLGTLSVRHDTPLEEVYERLNSGDRGCIAVVDDDGRFIGAITRARLLEVLLKHSQGLSAALENGQHRLLAWSSRLNDLNRASRQLLELIAATQSEEGLVRGGLEVLTRLIEARYGAVGFVDQEGRMTHFVYTGVTQETAERIGHPPEGRGLLGVVVREQQTLRIEDMGRDPRLAGFPPGHPRMKSLLAAPIADHGHVYGRVYLCDKVDGTPFTNEDEVLVTNFAQSLALALIHAREQAERVKAERQTAELLNENRKLTQRLFMVQEAERQSIARELHDELGQCVTAMQADAESIKGLSEQERPDIYRSAAAIGEVLDHLYDVIHAMMKRLRPTLLDDLGLVETLREMIADCGSHHPGIAFRLRTAGRLDDIGETMNIATYRIIQECLNNAVKHSAATEVDVYVCRTEDCAGGEMRCGAFLPEHCNERDALRLVVRDNGRGLSNGKGSGGLGLVGMRERVQTLGGGFSLESRSGGGLAVIIEIPLEPGARVTLRSSRFISARE